MDRRQRLRRDVEALDWRDFQRLVHDLVKKAHPQARSLESPDGGADTLVPPNADSAALVFQAKHTPRPSEIKWQHWTNSLDAALANHRPSHVTFVVSPDFNANEEHAFRTKLVDPHPAVVVDVWTLTDVSKLLEEHADVKTRYFGREHEDQITAALRAVQLGGPLQSGANLVQHAETLGRFANEHDKNYTYATTSAAPELPEPRWDEMNRPFMGLSVKGEQVAVYVNAWLREGAEGQAYFTFTDDDAGAEARERTRIELASGRDAVLRAGVHVQVVNAPTVMSEAFADGMEGAEVTIRPGDPVPLEIRIFGPDGACQTQTWDFRPIPPRRPGHVSFGYAADALFVEIELARLDEPNVRFVFNATGRFGHDVSENLSAARFLHAIQNHEGMVFLGGGLFPEDGLRVNAATRDRRNAGYVDARLEVYELLDEIERHCGVDFDIPRAITQDDFDAIGTAAAVIRTGAGTATFEGGEAMVAAADIPGVAERTRGSHITRPVVYPIFGQDVVLGLGEYVLPPVRVVEVIPHGTRPDSPARVKFVADGDGQMTFRLIDPSGESPAGASA